MKFIYRIATLIEWTTISYFAIPDVVFNGARLQCEEWISEVEKGFAQISGNTS